jgi:hypothetical protein
MMSETQTQVATPLTTQTPQAPAFDPSDQHTWSAEQRKSWNESGDIPEGPAPEKATGKKDQPAAKRDDGTEEVGSKQQHEPTADGDKLKQAVADATRNQYLSPQYEEILERASREPDFERVVENLHAPIFPKSAEGNARLQVMAYAMREISNSADVTYFLARPENSSVLLQMQNASPDRIAQTIHMISAELRFGKRSNGGTKPRAPKPISDVGGRGTAAPDQEADAIRRNDFRAAEAIWNDKLRRKARG